LCRTVDFRHGLPEPGFDPVRRVPIRVVGDDLLIGLFARQHWREHDAVVIAARLRPEQRDPVAVELGFEQMLKHTARGHAGTDDDEFFSHWTRLSQENCWAGAGMTAACRPMRRTDTRPAPGAGSSTGI